MDIEAILDRLPETANARPHLTHVGRHCDVEFLLEIGDHEFQITVHAGRVTGVRPGPFRMRVWRFAIRAGEHAWREFWSPVPGPGFNDIFAMASCGHAKIEGDGGSLLQHLRYVKELVSNRTRRSALCSSALIRLRRRSCIPNQDRTPTLTYTHGPAPT